MAVYVICVIKYYFLTEVTDFFALFFLNAHLEGLKETRVTLKL